MATKEVNIGSIGPFRFDDGAYKGIESDGEVQGNPITHGGGYSGSFTINDNDGSTQHNFTFSGGVLTSYTAT